MIRCTPLDGTFGVVVEGINVAEMDAGTFRKLAELLFTNRIVVIPEQHLSPDELVAFGGRWGTPTNYTDGGRATPEYPTIFILTNAPTFRNEAQRNDAAHWHTDGTFQAVPQSVTMLYGIEAPTTGGETMFVDAVAAYEALAPEMRTRIDSLKVVHQFFGGKPLPGEHIPKVVRLAHKEPLPDVVHPLVLSHPVTATRALYGVSGSAIGIVGMPEDESDDLLLQLKLHMIQSRFRQHYKVRPGQLLLWDNFSTMHSATPIEYSSDEGKRRYLNRISVQGLPACLSE